ncbi:hypothetical protein AVI53_09665 [Piscirickettsia salmonis]|nr:hypothetical protein PSLF89_62 [Piscirickettsia salmonis LF-89 = ATCC VR-1361]ALY04314.1 hypothetical protein AWE47_15420 [Piscirickettsia salmonis]AMA43871.1 hypothetical protein AWJ11_15590 [Piscirickettsia salmonis]AOS36799.1 hypothetical protein AVM72_12700 [Piscirickettsia salmonis]APS61963.1 hypothetical protein AVI53_09665 [Piscirickettsia salmonis]
MTIASILLSGCISHYSYYTPRPNDQSQCGILADNESIYIGTTQDFYLESKYYTNSGNQISQLLLETVNKYTTHIKRSKNYVTMQQGLIQARNQGYSIYIYPTIISWQRPMPTISWLIDHSEVRLSLYNVKSGKLLNDVIIRADQPIASQWFEKNSERLEFAFSKVIAHWYACQKNQMNIIHPTD